MKCKLKQIFCCCSCFVWPQKTTSLTKHMYIKTTTMDVHQTNIQNTDFLNKIFLHNELLIHKTWISKMQWNFWFGLVVVVVSFALCAHKFYAICSSILFCFVLKSLTKNICFFSNVCFFFCSITISVSFNYTPTNHKMNTKWW